MAIEHASRIPLLQGLSSRAAPRGVLSGASESPMRSTEDYLTIRVYGRSPRELERMGVELAWTPCHLGGRRPWMICPNCGRPVGVLYSDFLTLACRRCRGLFYPSTREHPIFRHIRRAQALRCRLGGSADLREPIPPKPARRHWHVYLRSARRIAAVEERIAMALPSPKPPRSSSPAAVAGAPVRARTWPILTRRVPVPAGSA